VRTVRGRVRAVASATCLLLLSSCTPQWVDDFARAFRMSTDEAIEVVEGGARRTDLPEEDFARIAINEAALIRGGEDEFSDVIAALSRSLKSRVEEAIEETLCVEFILTSLGSPAPTAGEVYQSIYERVKPPTDLQSFIQEFDPTNRVGAFVDLMESLEEGDPTGVAEELASILYC